MRSISLFAIGLVGLAGCSAYPEDIEPKYETSAAYVEFTCEGLAVETAALEIEEKRLVEHQQKRARSDRSWLGAPGAWRWSTAWARDEDETAEQLSEVRGRMSAADLAAASRNCR